MSDQAQNQLGLTCWALLVGINAYSSPDIPNLRGCLNDVAAMQRLLRDHMDVPGEQILTLVDGQATRDNILATFRSFLIDNPAIQHGDQLVFLFSGHGSLMRPAPDWSSAPYIQSLVPCDAQSDEVYNIPDRTLGALLQQLAAAKGNNITVILDACHSGSGTREAGATSLPRVRQISPDARIPPATLDRNVIANTSYRNAGPSGWGNTSMPYVLLAACRDREQAFEYQTTEDTDDAGWHGAMTYFLLRTMRELGDATLSYSDLYERVAAQVNQTYDKQMPQCEGSGRDRVLFSGMHIARSPWITVLSSKNNLLVLNAGSLHGLMPGAELSFFPTNLPTQAPNDILAEPVTTAVIESVRSTSAQARVTFGGPVLALSHCSVSKPVQHGPQLRVSVRADVASELISAKVLAAIQASTVLTLQTEGTASHDLAVELTANQWTIYDGVGSMLVQPQHNEAAELPFKLVSALHSIARHRILLGLENQVDTAQLVSKVKLRLRQVKPSNIYTDIASEATEASELTIFYDAEYHHESLYIIDVINTSAIPLYPHVFVLNPDYSIVRLYPNQGQQDAIQQIEFGHPGVVSVGILESGEEPISLYLPDGWDSCRDYIKVIVTDTPTDLAVLEQGSLEVPPRNTTRGDNSALQHYLDDISRGIRQVKKGVAIDRWATCCLPFTMVRNRQRYVLHANKTQVALGSDLLLHKPLNFTGELQVRSGEAITRDVREPQPPANLEQQRDVFAPIVISSTRSLHATALTIDLIIDDATRRSIDATNPLLLELPTNGEAGEILAVLFDGQDYRFVGSGNAEHGTVRIVDLPIDDEAPAAGTRGLAHTIRLFFYKKIGRHSNNIGLRRASIGNDTVSYAPVIADEFAPGDSIALFIHGFSDNSRRLVRDTSSFVLSEIHEYDHILTFDYESFASGIDENAASLALALRAQCGMHANDQLRLDIFAHSMGGIVARCMIELHECYDIVDRLVMAGTPNRGSTLASSGRGLTFLMTGLLNGIDGLPFVGTANWLFEQFQEQGKGMADLEVDSELLRRLNALESPTSTPYLVLAGSNTLKDKERNRINRLAHKTLSHSLDGLFGETNDLVVGLSCIVGIRGNVKTEITASEQPFVRYPNLRIETFQCNHFDYYTHAQVRSAIKAWIHTTNG